jgi:NAD(P)-dependent dehydrogenase (short-subunit alcohol dehydrogenase family)
LKRGSGRIINIGSELGYKGDSLGSHYTASKAGIRALTKSLALAAGPGITVNTVAPGPTDTDAFRSYEECNEENREKLPLQRFVRPSEVGRSVVFLASSDGDCYTGQTLDPNCGAVLD